MATSNASANGDPFKEATYKILVLGDSAVGKTCLIYRYCDREFYESYISTIGIDCRDKVIQLDDTRVRLRIWDTAGQERFRTLTQAYYRGAQGIILMYDITNEETFHHLSYWLSSIDKMAPPDIGKILIGNKCDLYEERQVEEERGRKLASTFGIDFFETSCKTDVNVDAAFQLLSMKIKETQDSKVKTVFQAAASFALNSEGSTDSKETRSSWCPC